ncbi:hypothetical protein BV511_13210 [Methylorubrum extorquens]|uniref:hypothetical protein n=1 Tax=Methylorubrum extorquens TaxID=408 RepID=UPI0009727B82|nr:hypothetical protein [Methylorubrum extorquens]APX85589.1 hypothetical protein BV511_13210 [Methylorubrum extorquens]
MEQPSYRRRRKPKPGRISRITVPDGVSPHVKLVFAEMQRQSLTYGQVAERSGVLLPTLKAWRHKNAPGLDSLGAVLDSLGWTFVPVPREEVLPEDMRAGLAEIAERYGMSMPETIQGLISVITGIHDGLPPPAAPAPCDPPANPAAAA